MYQYFLAFEKWVLENIKYSFGVICFYKNPPDRQLKNGSTFDSLFSLINGLTLKAKNT